MIKRNFMIGVAILFIGVSIIINGYFVGEAIKSIKMGESITDNEADKVLNLPQAAKYMNMTEDEVQGIIKTETEVLEKMGSFDGKMFPYFTIDDKQYFYKNEIDEWLKEASSNHKNYNITDGWIL